MTRLPEQNSFGVASPRRVSIARIVLRFLVDGMIYGCDVETGDVDVRVDEGR